MFYLYILYSAKKDAYYVGHTGDVLAERLRKHNSDHKGYTGSVDDWIIVYTEQYLSKAEAYRREREIKSWKNRKRIEALIKEKNLEHPDL